MGDRCYVTLEIGGEIKTVEALNDIIEAIECDGGNLDDPSNVAGDLDLVIAVCASEGWMMTFHFNDVNYGNLDCTAMLEEHSLDYVSNNEAGGDYGAGFQSYDGLKDRRCQWTEVEDDKMQLKQLREILEMHPALEAVETIRKSIENIESSQWTKIRPIPLSEEVRQHLAPKLARWKMTKAA